MKQFNLESVIVFYFLNQTHFCIKNKIKLTLTPARTELITGFKLFKYFILSRSVCCPVNTIFLHK